MSQYDQNLQTIMSLSNMENQNLTKMSSKSSASIILDNAANKKNKLSKQILEQQLIENRQFYLEQKKKEVEESKLQKKKDIIHRRAEEEQKEIVKVPFIPLKQRIQQSIEQKSIRQVPWLSIQKGHDVFDLNQPFKPTAEEKKQYDDMKEYYKTQRFDYKNFKTFLKTKFSTFNSTAPSLNQLRQTHSEQLIARSPDVQGNDGSRQQQEPYITRSASTANGIRATPNPALSKQRTQSNERNSKTNDPPVSEHQPIIKERKQNGNNLAFKRIQSPLNTSISNTSINKFDFVQNSENPTTYKNHQIISMNNNYININNNTNNNNHFKSGNNIAPPSLANKGIKLRIPLSRIGSPPNNIAGSPATTMNFIGSPLNSLNSYQDRAYTPLFSQTQTPQNPMAKTTNSFKTLTQENQIPLRKQSHSLFNSSVPSQNHQHQQKEQHQSRGCSPNWKYGYNNNNKANEIFSNFQIDTYNVKISSGKSQNLVFKPNGPLGNLFSDYSKDKSSSNQPSSSSTTQSNFFPQRERVISMQAPKKQIISS